MDAHEIWSAAQLAPGEGIEDGVARIEALIQADALAAQRFNVLCAALQHAYDGETVEAESLSVYCHMQSGWKSERTVQAELHWTDVRDEPLALGPAIDAAASVISRLPSDG